jgi:hypothetical protein
MANYSVRIELREAEVEDYASLDAAMIEEGFVRWIVAGGGIRQTLPTGEYNLIDSDLHQSVVLGRAEEAAYAVKPTPAPSIMVTESAGRIWSGLSEWQDN